MTDAKELINTSLDNLRQVMSRKENMIFSVTQTISDFRINLPQVINLSSNIDHEIALISFSAFNTLFNITAANNNIRYFNGTVWKIITIAPGAYEVAAINNEIRRQMLANGDVGAIGATGLPTYYFNLYPNLSTSCSIIDLTNGYQIDFNDTTDPNNMRLVLGYNQGIYQGLYNQSQNIINIQPYNSIFINCDLCTNSYINGSSIQAIASIPSNLVPSGYKIIYIPVAPVYLPVIKSKYSFIDFHIWITNEFLQPLNFNGENITMTFQLRSI